MTAFDQPLDVAFAAAPAGIVPAYSTDGTTWVEIPRIPSPPVLPAGWPDGWYRADDGVLHVLTRHATLFGLLASRSTVVKALRLGFKTPSRITPSRRPVLVVRLSTTLPGTVTVTLRHAARAVGSWHLHAGTASRAVRLVLPLRARAPGTYRLTVLERAGGETAARSGSVVVTRQRRRR